MGITITTNQHQFPVTCRWSACRMPSKFRSFLRCGRWSSLLVPPSAPRMRLSHHQYQNTSNFLAHLGHQHLFLPSASVFAPKIQHSHRLPPRALCDGRHLQSSARAFSLCAAILLTRSWCSTFLLLTRRVAAFWTDDCRFLCRPSATYLQVSGSLRDQEEYIHGCIRARWVTRELRLVHRSPSSSTRNSDRTKSK
jgi:hypothetical protein